MTALISKGFLSRASSSLSPRSPGRTAAKLNLAFGNEFIHLICMQLSPTNPNFKGKRGLIFFKRVTIEQPDPWERLKLFRVSPPGFYKGKATQSGRDLTSLSIKDAAGKPHSVQLISQRESKRVLLKSAVSSSFLSLDLLICEKGGFKHNPLHAWVVKPRCLSKLWRERDSQPTDRRAHPAVSNLMFLK